MFLPPVCARRVEKSPLGLEHDKFFRGRRGITRRYTKAFERHINTAKTPLKNTLKHTKTHQNTVFSQFNCNFFSNHLQRYNNGITADENSRYVLGSYKITKEKKSEKPTLVGVIGTQDMTVSLVELGTSYTFRSIGRNPNDTELVVGADGALHIIDLRRTKVAQSIDVVAPWKEPTNWQHPRPTLRVVGDTAYITEIWCLTSGSACYRFAKTHGST